MISRYTVQLYEETIVKIDPKSPFSGNVADTLPLAAARDGVNAQAPLSRASSLAREGPSVSTTMSLPSTVGDFDAARVARIREDISAGRYRIDTSKIADGLLASVRELIANRVA